MCFVIYSVFRVFINLVVSNMSCEDLKLLASEIAHLATKLCPSFISPSEFPNDYTLKKRKGSFKAVELKSAPSSHP